jgi:Group XII secretory phospholipase A2 precursor (PLA2G12)
LYKGKAKVIKNSCLIKFFLGFNIFFIPIFTQSLPARADSNGCGSGWTGRITPNAPAGTSFKFACDRHDECYDTLGSNRQECDNQWHNNMLAACREAYPDGSFLGKSIRKPQRITCNGAADAYYRVVRSEGGKAHQDAQRAASNKQDPKTKMIISSYQKILGRNPNQAEINYWNQRISKTNETYDQILEVHREWKRRGGK